MMNLVYLTSSSYSGSTLLTFLLNTHPQVTTIGEMKGAAKDPDRHLCSCGQPIGHCPFWQELVSRLHERGIMFDHRNVWSQCGFRVRGSSLANRVIQRSCYAWPVEKARDLFLAFSPTCQQELPGIYRTNEAFVEAATALTKCSVFVDSSKDPVRLKYLQNISSFKIKVIHLVRDGRGVMNSFVKRTKRSPEDIASQWVNRQREISRVLSGFDSSDYITVHYEDLCANPDDTLSTIFTFLGLSFEGVSRDFRSVEHHILGNEMRFGNLSDIKLDTKWTYELNTRQLEAFERIAGPLNRSFGYDSYATSSAVLA